MLAKFAVSLGLGWAGPELPVPAVSPGHGEEQELTPLGRLCCRKGSWRDGGGWESSAMAMVAWQSCHRSPIPPRTGPCQPCAMPVRWAAVLVGGCPGRISPSR